MSTKDLLAKRLKMNTQKHLDHQKEHFEYSKELRRNIKIAEIQLSPNQPRKIFDAIELQGLADSIEEIGLLQPISVRNTANGYELIAGERRLKAHQILKKQTIEAIIIDVSEDDVALLTLAENLKREDLTDYEIYVGLHSLNENLKKNKTKLAKSLGMNREDMYKYLAYEKLPQEILNDLNISPRLLGRAAATQVKKYLSDYEHSQLSLDALLYAWNKVKNLSLEQMKLVPLAVKHLEEKPDIPFAESKQKHLIHHNGQVAGKIQFNEKNMKVTLNTTIISDSNMERLEHLLKEILIDANKV